MHQTTDALIVGAGLAGLYTALKLPEDWHITVMSAHEDNSSLAQGGVAACLNTDDSYEAHIHDTMKAGHYANDPEAVRHLVTSGPRQIHQLMDMGTEFDTDPQGFMAATLEGGHSAKRILHIQGDQTGKGIMDVLRTRLRDRRNIHQIHEARLFELIKEGSTILGVRYLKKGQLHTLQAGHTILATGGIGDLYSQTTNHTGAIGTGIALAHQAGALCRDMRYIQFHPTAFYDTDRGRPFLISEALRGEGAHLLDQQHRRFMSDFDSRLELAPRDIVAKAIQHTLNGQTNPYVYLDTRHLDSHYLTQRFPGISRHLKEKGLTLGRDLIPVTPVAHYTIGGIQVNRYGETSLKNLYACGETTSTGVHGANRLASNSLLECLVFGNALANWLSQLGPMTNAHVLSETPHPGLAVNDDVPDKKIIHMIQHTLTHCAGIDRSAPLIRHSIDSFKALLATYEQTKTNYWSAFYIHTMLYCAIMVLEDALENPSLGCHTIHQNTLPETEERFNHDRTYEHTTA